MPNKIAAFAGEVVTWSETPPVRPVAYAPAGGAPSPDRPRRSDAESGGRRRSGSRGRESDAEREADDEAAAGAGVRDADLARVRLDDAAGDGQAETGPAARRAGGLAPEGDVEQARQVLVRDPA